MPGLRCQEYRYSRRWERGYAEDGLIMTIRRGEIAVSRRPDEV